MLSTASRPGAALRLAHYWWPVVMAWSLAGVARRASGREVSSAGLVTLLLGALAAYSLDRLRPGGRWTRPLWLRAALLLAVAAALAGCLRMLPEIGRARLALLSALSVVALGYPWMKRLPWVKAVLVPAVWTCAAVALPLGLASVLTPVAVPLFLLLAAGCLLCDVKDAEADRRSGVRSLPVELGIGPAIVVAAGLAGVGAVVAWEQQRMGLLVCGLCLMAVAPCRGLLAREAIGPLAVDFVLTLPGLLIAAHLV